MTEDEWLASTDPYPLLEFLRKRGSKRKMRLFSCGCCRQSVWERLIDERSRNAIEVAERYAEGLVPAAALREAHAHADRARQQPRTVEIYPAIAAALAADAQHSRAREVAERIYHTIWYAAPVPNRDAQAEAERAAHLVLVRCVFGNPFRNVPIEPSWLRANDGLIPRLAQAIYTERSLPTGSLDVSRLAVLADALEEAGCTDVDVLSHCRGPGPHILGCWVVDALLDRK